MRGNLLLVFTLLCGFSLLAQRQADNIINGDCFQNPEIGNCDPPNANSVYRFNDSTLEEIIEPLDLSLSTDYSRAAYSDSAGNLAFASNGWRLVNNSGVVLSEKLWFDWIPHPGDSPETTNVLN
ncbi:MAG: hypothetical protein KDC13_07290, partial [Bacteroidetes bacterium]|nr:hypothetical protein [Bacteroidota bacterium]